jgi:hypothetical protein
VKSESGLLTILLKVERRRLTTARLKEIRVTLKEVVTEDSMRRVKVAQFATVLPRCRLAATQHPPLPGGRTLNLVTQIPNLKPKHVRIPGMYALSM